MPRAPRRSENPVFARAETLCIFFVLGLACREQTPPDPRPTRQVDAVASAPPARVRRPAPTGEFDCRELRPAPKAENTLVPETIDLLPPGTGKRVFFSKKGEVVTFDREAFLKAARCLKLEQAIRFIEEETGREQESPIIDAFQLSYVVAALLDAGRAGVRLVDESESRRSIVRDDWAADGCAGHCRSFGRIYRLSADDSTFFFRITDNRN